MNLTCDYCKAKTDHLYRSEHPKTFKPISVCEDCEWGAVNGLYYKTQSRIKRRLERLEQCN